MAGMSFTFDYFIRYLFIYFIIFFPTFNFSLSLVPLIYGSLFFFLLMPSRIKIKIE